MKWAVMKKRIIVVGATSGIGREVAKLFAGEGWSVGAVGRRSELLESLQDECPEGSVMTAVADVTEDAAVEAVGGLADRMGGMDVFLLSSGIGFQNVGLDVETEMRTVGTNCEGFTRMVTWAFNYFRDRQEETDSRGHIAVISSIAGTKGLGVAPSYSATKRFQNTYIEALSQLAAMRGLRIDFTDIRPGFVATDLLRGTASYPMLMEASKVARSIVSAIKKRKRTVVIDWRYGVLVWFWRLIPGWLWVRLRIVKTKEKN